MSNLIFFVLAARHFSSHSENLLILLLLFVICFLEQKYSSTNFLFNIAPRNFRPISLTKICTFSKVTKYVLNIYLNITFYQTIYHIFKSMQYSFYTLYSSMRSKKSLKENTLTYESKFKSGEINKII